MNAKRGLLCAISFLLSICMVLPAATVVGAEQAAVAKIGDVEYESLIDAVEAVPADGTAATITMIDNETVEVSGYAITIAAGKNITIDLNGYEVVGNNSTSTTSALIRNLGTLTITDSSDDADGKLQYAPTQPWRYTQADPSGYASNLIRNEGTLTVNGGTLYNAGEGSATYAIDNYTAGKVTINGGTVDAKKASAIRMFYNNGGELTVTGGTIGRYISDDDCTYMGIQVQSGTNAAVNVTGGTVVGEYALYSNASGSSSVSISGGVFDGYVGFAASVPTISITGGSFLKWVGTWGTQTGFITGGLYAYEPEDKLIGEGYVCVANTDDATKEDHPFKVVPARPTATVTELTPEENLPLFDTKTFQPTGEKVDALEAEYKFKADEPTAAQLAYYGNWYADYRVSFNKNIAADSFGLYGAYDGYGKEYSVAFLFPVDMTTEDEMLLLNSAGLGGVTYNDCVNNIDEFICGVFNLDEANYGTTMTVELVIWDPNDADNKIVCGSQDYTFKGKSTVIPPLPEAIVTEVENPESAAPLYDANTQGPTGNAVPIDAEFKFEAVEPSQAQLDYYGDWKCDYRVSFNRSLAANSFGLYGEYVGWDADPKVAFTFPTNTGTEPIYLLSRFLPNYQVTYRDIWTVVNPFICGVFNLSDDNAGAVMTVELVMWAPGTDPAKAEVRATQEYVFPSRVPPLPTATVTELTPEENLPLFDTKTFQPTGEKVDALEAEYKFESVEPTEAQLAYYGNWCADYRVTFSDNLDAKSFGLYGKYGDYNVAIKFPTNTGTDPIYLLEWAGLDNHLTYNEILDHVDPFTCGVFNLSDDNIGRTINVELVIWDPANPDVKHTVNETSYTFKGKSTIIPPLPAATVTDLEPITNKDVFAFNDIFGDPVTRVASIDSVYRFEADDPSDETEAYYRGWNCDYVVQFSSDLAAESFGLYGAYGSYDKAFLFPTGTGTAPIPLLATAGLSGVTYGDLLESVNPFTCGVFNLSGENVGETMNVKLVLSNPEDPSESYVLVEKEYVFGAPTQLVGPYTVALTSTDTNGHTGIANLTGGGRFMNGEQITVTAPSVEGYRFIGWYRESYSSDGPISDNPSYTFTVGEDVSLVAVYDVVAVKGLLHVKGNAYKVNDGELQTSHNDFDIEIGASTVLSYTGEDFLYWVNISGNIVSTSPTYNFTMVNETTLKLISSRNDETSPSVYVVFKNAFEQTLNEGRVIDLFDAEALFPKTNPSKMTLVFDKWVFEDTGDEATADSIAARADASAPVVIVVPKYIESENTYTVIVKTRSGGTDTVVEDLAVEVPISSSKSIKLSDIVSVTGLSADNFSCWMLNDLGIVSYDPAQYTVTGKAGDTVTLTAVFDGKADPEPTIAITQFYSSMNGEKYRISAVLSYYLPEGYTAHKSGFVRSTSGSFAEADLVIGAENTKTHETPFTTFSAIYNLGLNTKDAEKTFYFRAYVIYEYGGEIITLYSPMVVGSYSSLQQ